MKQLIAIFGVSGAILLIIGCGKAWQMNYGEPAAQFNGADIATKGTVFVGEKVTVKGAVATVDTSVPGDAVVTLEDGIICKFGKFKAMAEGCKVGEIVFVDGFLKRCNPGDVVLDPAIGRDPTAPFSPK